MIIRGSVFLRPHIQHHSFPQELRSLIQSQTQSDIICTWSSALCKICEVWVGMWEGGRRVVGKGRGYSLCNEMSPGRAMHQQTDPCHRIVDVVLKGQLLDFTTGQFGSCRVNMVLCVRESPYAHHKRCL